jgi:hypothetical protein
MRGRRPRDRRACRRLESPKRCQVVIGCCRRIAAPASAVPLIDAGARPHRQTFSPFTPTMEQSHE